MRWSEVYLKCNNKKYSQITSIKGELKLKSNIKNFLIENKWYIILTIIAVIALVLYTSKLNISIILATLGILLVLVALMIYYSTYRIISKKDKLIINANMTETVIEYKDLLNIFLDKKRDRVFLFIPFYIYSFNIIFFKGDTQMIMSLPTTMLSKKDVMKFFKNFDVEVLEQQKEEDQRIEQKRASRKAIMITAIIMIVVFLIVGAIITAINSNQ